MFFRRNHAIFLIFAVIAENWTPKPPAAAPLGGFSIAWNAPGSYNACGAISLAQPCPSGQWGQKEVAPMEQFLSNVLAGLLANIIVLIIDRKFFR